MERTNKNDKSESLQKRHKDWIDIVNRRDAEAYSWLLTDDAVWFPPTGDPIGGREAFKEWLTPFFDRFNYNFSIADLRYRVSGNRAVSKGKFTSIMTPKVGGEPMQHSGTFTVLWYRVGEEWNIEHYIDDTDM